MGAIADLIRAGVDPELVERVHREMLHAAGTSPQPQRSARQERNRRYHEAHKVERLKSSQLDVCKTLSDASDAPQKEAPQTPKEKTTPSHSEASPLHEAPRKAKRSSDEECRLILAEVLSPETVTDVFAHRKSKKAPLTPGAAKGLVRDFRDFGDPEAAARLMMARGWTGFNASWVRDGRARAGPGDTRPPPKRNPYRTVGLDHEQAPDPSDFSAPAAYRPSPEDRACAIEGRDDAGRGEPVGDLLDGDPFAGRSYGSSWPC